MDAVAAQPDVVIVGAGPAGLMAAIAAAERGARAVLIETSDCPGPKLLVTGGGRSNVTNTSAPEEFMAAFGRRGRFAADALRCLDPEGLRAFLSDLGVPTHAPDGFHVYPMSGSARDVRDALVLRRRMLGVSILLGTRASGLVVESGEVRAVESRLGRIPARAVVLATGGKSHPTRTLSEEGYELARDVGHTVTPLVPALVPLTTRETWPRALTGVSLPNVRVWIDLPKLRKTAREGGLLFTRKGVSGPVALDISGDVAALLEGCGGERAGRLEEVPLRVEVARGMGAAEWDAAFEAWRSSEGRRKVVSLLSERLPGALAGVVTRLVGEACGRDTAGTRASGLTRDEQRRLVAALSALPLAATGTEGFARAMVTRGGVSLDEVAPRTLESRLVRGLFFAGEVLDLDGPCGGYNLQWAFSSGRLAGLSAAASAVR